VVATDYQVNMRRRNDLLIASSIPTLCVLVALRSGRGAASALAFSPPVLPLVPVSRTTPLRVREKPTVIGKSTSTRPLHLRCGGRSATATGIIWSRATDVEEKSISSGFLGVNGNETDVLCSSAEERSSYVGAESENYHSVEVGEDGNGYTLILVLCFFVTVLSALDRVAMSVALVPISAEFLLTDTVKGQISSVFSIGYGLAILPCGLLVAAASPRIVMAAGVALWSIATIGTPLAAGLIVSGGTTLIEGTDAGAAALTTTFTAENVAPLLAVRAVMGGAESVVLPAVQRILANWVPPSNKSLAVASVLSGFQLGTILAYLISPVVIDEFGGWRGMFFLYGAVGILWLVPWLAFANDVPSEADIVDQGHNCKEEETVLVNTLRDDDMSLVPEHAITSSRVRVETESVTSESEPPEIIIEPELPSSSAFEEAATVLQEAPWKKLATSRAVWAMAIAHAANNFGLYINLSWTPTFYAEQYGLSIKESALLSILPSVAGAFGGLLAGNAADYVIERSGGGLDERTAVRKAFQAIALLGPAFSLFTLANDMPSSPFTAQLLLTGAIGMQAFNCAGYGAATQEKASKWTGLLYSVTSLPGVIFGSIGVALTGDILDKTGQDWSSVFSLVALVDVVGALAFVVLYNSKREFD